MTKKRELARADRIFHGLWRLRLPLPWPGVPHVNAFAIASGSGIVLVDTGMADPGALAQLERALDQAGGLRLEHIRLVVCTHAHSDHYGLAGPIVDASGAELWMHPNHAHMSTHVDDPDKSLDRRIEVARQSGVPADVLEIYEQRRGQGIGVERFVPPDRDLVPGVEVTTDLGTWQVHETPGHAPSHVVLHQPDRGLLLSGDHLLGRVSLYYDFGYSPDPAGEFLSSLDVVEDLHATLCLAGHGRPFREVHGKVEATRAEALERIDRVRRAVASGEPKTPYEIVPLLLGVEEVTPLMLNWGLSETLCYLQHLERRGEAEKDSDGRWRAVPGAG